jgi:hypothetical protein
MARKAKAPERLEGWHKLTETAGQGKRALTYNITLDLQYGGMSFGDIRNELERIERQFGKEFEKFKVEVEMEPEPYSYDDKEYARTYFYGWRKETDEEYNARLAKAAEMEAAREARERVEFERLAKKFADKA